MTENFERYRREQAVLVSVLGLVWAICAGIAFWALRDPLPDHILSLTGADIVRAVAVSCALTLAATLPFMMGTFGLQSVLRSLAAFWVLAGLLTFVAPMVPLAFDGVVALVVCAGLGMLIRQLASRETRPALSGLVLIAFVALILMIVHVTMSFNRGLSSPFALEMALMGRQKSDTLFHAALASGLLNHGVSSAGWMVWRPPHIMFCRTALWPELRVGPMSPL